MASAWVYWLALLLAGFIAAGGKIAAKNPDAQKALNALVPFQGIIGLFALIYGLISFFDKTLDMFKVIDFIPVIAITYIVSNIILIILGFLLGYSLIAKFIGGASEEAKAKLAATQVKLAKSQANLGYLAILLALWHIIQNYAEIVA